MSVFDPMRCRSLEDLPNLWKDTYDLVAQVPKGRVTTYGEVAKALGDIVASRFVGLAMSRNDDIVRVPCRRVVQSDGSLGGYIGGGPWKKKRLLREEGIVIRGDKVANLEEVMFRDFVTSYPLEGLKRRQRSLKRNLRLRHTGPPFERIAGVDVAYHGDHAYAALVVLDIKTGKELERYVVEGEAGFPYVPTYLAFRELPVVAPLMRHLDVRTVLVYDGNGILHPEGFGVACHAGVAFGVPTIGVAKKLLCGELSGTSSGGIRKVVLQGRVVGFALAHKAGSKPVYVSPGHLISPSQALQISNGMVRHRVPEPTRLAHIASEAARRAANDK
jgi:deoxyribonuclease V